MTERYLIALDAAARSEPEPIDLAIELVRQFPTQVKIVRRGYKGRSVTVAIRADARESIERRMPYVTIEPEEDMPLL